MVGNLNKTESVYSLFSHLALQHTFLLSINVIFLHTCAQVCVVSYPILKPTKKHVKFLWLCVEDEYVNKVIGIVCNYRCNAGALFYLKKSVLNEWEEPTTIVKTSITNHLKGFVLYLETIRWHNFFLCRKIEIKRTAVFSVI